MNQLEGKVALITGATGGIGQATVRRFIEEDARVMVGGRSKIRLDALAREIASENLDTFVAEATDEAATAASVAATVERYGGLQRSVERVHGRPLHRRMKETCTL